MFEVSIDPADYDTVAQLIRSEQIAPPRIAEILRDDTAFATWFRRPRQMHNPTTFTAALHHDMDDAILALHDSAMSGDPLVACASRLMKMFIPLSHQWLDDERARHTKPSDIIFGATNANLSTLMTIIFSTVPLKSVPAVLDIIAADLQQSLRRAAQIARDQAAQQQKK